MKWFSLIKKFTGVNTLAKWTNLFKTFFKYEYLKNYLLLTLSRRFRHCDWRFESVHNITGNILHHILVCQPPHDRLKYKKYINSNVWIKKQLFNEYEFMDAMNEWTTPLVELFHQLQMLVERFFWMCFFPGHPHT